MTRRYSITALAMAVWIGTPAASAAAIKRHPALDRDVPTRMKRWAGEIDPR